MESKKQSISLGLIAGVIFVAVAALNALQLFSLMISWGFFSFPGLMYVAAMGFFGVALIMQSRDILLLAAGGVFTVVMLAFDGFFMGIAALLLEVLILLLTTDYVPNEQLKDLAKKLFFVPAIPALIGGLMGVYGLMSLLVAVAVTAAYLLCGMWLSNADLKQMEADIKAGASAVSGPEVKGDGYCDLFKHALLLMITFGIWQLIWVYRMTGHLNRVKDAPYRNPVNKLLLYIFVPFYAVYWNYKSAQLMDQLAESKGVKSKLAVWCLLLSMVMPMIAMILMQDKMNKIVSVEKGVCEADFDVADYIPTAAPSKSLEMLVAYCGLFKHVLLLSITFGIWQLMWVYRMTGYLNCVEGEPERKPVNKLLLYIFVPFYAVYWNYKSAQRIDKLAKSKGVESNLTVVTLVSSLVVGMVPMVLMQDKVNEILAAEHAAADFRKETVLDFDFAEEMASEEEYLSE